MVSEDGMDEEEEGCEMRRLTYSSGVRLIRFGQIDTDGFVEVSWQMKQCWGAFIEFL